MRYIRVLLYLLTYKWTHVAVEKFFRQGVLSEEARRECKQIKLNRVKPGRHEHVTYMELADHL